MIILTKQCVMNKNMSLDQRSMSQTALVLIIYSHILFIVKSSVDLGKIIKLFKSQIIEKSRPRYAENSEICIQLILKQIAKRINLK